MQGLDRRPEAGKRVIIVGACMAGLVAGHEPARARNHPLILEAQNRVGVRARVGIARGARDPRGPRRRVRA